MRHNYHRCVGLLIVLMLGLSVSGVSAQESKPAKRLLLLGQGPDGHPAGTHEYLQGLELLSRPLRTVPGLEVQVVLADAGWSSGPGQLAQADGALLYLAEGAKWISSDPQRYAAFEALAARGGGLGVLHWGMGTREAAPIAPFVRLFGGCHGGPDRKYVIAETEISMPHPDHPILRGLQPFTIRDEFYYRLKWPQGKPFPTPLWQVRLDGELETVAWAWEREEGGRSFGFSGAHFHDNWRESAYRQLVCQAAVWMLQLPIPEQPLR